MKKLTPSKINQIAFAARDGTADPDDVRAALLLFCQCSLERKAIPARLIGFAAESFCRFFELKGHYGPDERVAMTLESAFGLARKKGRPKADEQRRIRIAAEVVRLRLSGVSHQEALAGTAETFCCATAVVARAFRDHRMSAVTLVRSEFPSPPSEDEVTRLEGILLNLKIGVRKSRI
jgi:hypothetical protein